jgi:hypothetical protein
VTLAENIIEVNTEELACLEKSATIYLYNLSFNNPRILRNGEICPSSICQEVEYSSGILVVNITGFTTYSSEETPEGFENEVLENQGSSGGNILIRNFSLDKEVIKFSLKQGENDHEVLIITNTGNTELNIFLEVSNLDKFIVLSEENFLLKAGESKNVRIDIYAKENIFADSYIGKIIVRGSDIKKTTTILLEIKEKNPLFDIGISLLNKQVIPGEKLKSNIQITNMGDLENIDLLLYLSIKDLEGKTIDYREESIAIEKELNLFRSITVPNLPKGKYIVYSRVSYLNISASSSEVFEVLEMTPTKNLSFFE